jgi:hypothetical protein
MVNYFAGSVWKLKDEVTEFRKLHGEKRSGLYRYTILLGQRNLTGWNVLDICLNFLYTTQRHIPEDTNLNTDHGENLK